jgi:hypothetical protein
LLSSTLLLRLIGPGGRTLPTDIGEKQPPTPRPVDNKGDRKIEESAGSKERSKHIEVQHIYVQEKFRTEASF